MMSHVTAGAADVAESTAAAGVGTRTIGDDRIGWFLLAVAVVFAFIVQSGFFASADAIRGDIEYHRGVALTMTAGNFEGGGPLPGLLSYYGGLYPLVIGWGSELTGLSFDRFLSVVSWFAPVALPLALFALGRRIWPAVVLEAGTLAFVGTVGSSVPVNRNVEWANSVLPSGANLWPLFPRDVALVLLILALVVALGEASWWRAVATGALVAAATCVQAQFGVLALIVVVGWRFASAERGRRVHALGWSTLMAASAAVLAVWWWVPRLVAVWRYRPLALQSYPDTGARDLSPDLLFAAVGAVGLLAVPGLVESWRDRERPPRFFALWLLAMLPFAAAGMALGDQGVITSRRALLFAAIPLVVIAGRGAAWLIRVMPLRTGVVVIVSVLAVSGVIESLHLRDAPLPRWTDGAPTCESFRASDWRRATSELRALVRADGGESTVVAPDADAAYIWSSSGAQPTALWLSGSMKVGFDAERATGAGVVRRSRSLQRAFREGRDGICRLARGNHAGAIVLRTDGGLLAVHDLRPGLPFRVAPQDRSEQTIERTVAPGITYRDLNADETLELAPGARHPLGFTDPAVRRLTVESLGPAPPGLPALLVLETATGTVEPIVQVDGATVYETFEVATGVRARDALVARAGVQIDRITGSVPVPRSLLGSPDRLGPREPVVLSPDELCTR